MSELAIIEENLVSDRAEEQLVTMTVDGQQFGLSILSVQDIVETHAITQVPLAPSAISGVMNLRGRIVTVLNLRRILGKTDDSESRMGVTVEYKGDLYTILVDQIGEVRLLDQGDFEAVPSTLDPILKQLCTGIYRMDEELLAVLDVDQILDPETIAQTPQIRFIARPKDVPDSQKRIAANKKLADEAAEENDNASTTDDASAEDSTAPKKAAPRKSKGAFKKTTSKKAVAKPSEDSDATADADKADDPTPKVVALKNTDDDAKKDADEAVEIPSEAAPAAAVAAPEPSPASAASSESSPNATVFEDLGGAGVLTGIVESFYERVLADKSLADFYDGADMDAQMDALQVYLQAALGGPKDGAVPSGHSWLVPKKGMDDDNFNACQSLMEATLQAKSVPEGVIFRVLAAVELKRESIVD
jgi:chemotaxis signal transduction protein/truncated hemoglobin YjbI